MKVEKTTGLNIEAFNFDDDWYPNEEENEGVGHVAMVDPNDYLIRRS